MVTANVDMQEPTSGIILVTGNHGYPECPQALLGKDGEEWYVEDSYGDLDRDGKTARKDFFEKARTRKGAIRKWLAHLGLEAEIKTEREY
jgi:hypothetical protein